MHVLLEEQLGDEETEVGGGAVDRTFGTGAAGYFHFEQEVFLAALQLLPESQVPVRIGDRAFDEFPVVTRLVASGQKYRVDGQVQLFVLLQVGQKGVLRLYHGGLGIILI